MLVTKPETQTVVRELEGHQGPANCGAPSPDGRWFATGGDDLGVRLWDTETWSSEQLYSHDAAVRVVAISKAGFVASGDDNGTLKLFDRATKQVTTLASGGPVGALAFTPDGEHVVASALDHALTMWNVRAPAEPRVLIPSQGELLFIMGMYGSPANQSGLGHIQPPTLLAFASDGSLLSGSDEVVRWSQDRATTAWRSKRVHDYSAKCTDGSRVVLLGNGVAVLDLATGEVAFGALPEIDARVNRGALSACLEGDTLWVGTRAGRILRYALDPWTPWDGPPPCRVWSVTAVDDKALVQPRDGTIRVFAKGALVPEKIIEDFRGKVPMLRTSKTGPVLVYAENRCALFDRKTLEPLGIWNEGKWINGAIVSGDEIELVYTTHPKCFWSSGKTPKDFGDGKKLAAPIKQLVEVGSRLIGFGRANASTEVLTCLRGATTWSRKIKGYINGVVGLKDDTFALFLNDNDFTRPRVEICDGATGEPTKEFPLPPMGDAHRNQVHGENLTYLTMWEGISRWIHLNLTSGAVHVSPPFHLLADWTADGTMILATQREEPTKLLILRAADASIIDTYVSDVGIDAAAFMGDSIVVVDFESRTHWSKAPAPIAPAAPAFEPWSPPPPPEKAPPKPRKRTAKK